MITNKVLKQVNSLGNKKGRKALGAFVVEGKKSVEEFIAAGFKPQGLYTTQAIFHEDSVVVSQQHMQRMSFLKNASPYLGVFRLPTEKNLPLEGRILVLDQLADPGNLGTIIRVCDWFGIKHIVSSLDTVDCFNPKVVQSSMGSLARVHCHYRDLKDLLDQTKRPIYGTFLEGESIYAIDFPKNAMIVMGSEANGISHEITSLIQQKITIPRKSASGPESLNVAIATSLVLGELFR